MRHASSTTQNYAYSNRGKVTGSPGSPCGSANPCVWNVPQSGTMQVVALVHNRLKKATAHVDVVPCPTGDPLQDNPTLRRLERTVWDNSNASDQNQSNRVERAGILIDSAGVKDSMIFLPLNPNPNLNGPCRFTPGSFGYPGGWTITAIVHSHPFQDGEAENCRPGQAYGENPTSGWASGLDWRVSQRTGIPSYIVDFHRINRIRGDSANIQPMTDPNGNILLDVNGDTLDFVVDSASRTNHSRRFSRQQSCSPMSSRLPVLAGGLPLLVPAIVPVKGRASETSTPIRSMMANRVAFLEGK